MSQAPRIATRSWRSCAKPCIHECIHTYRWVLCSRAACGIAAGAAYSDTDVEKLRGAIQGLCQSTNPLGRCMDLVHEDLSLMNAEMDKWQVRMAAALRSLYAAVLKWRGFRA
eukprot:TRINITY_DN2205_c0_g1_i1.p3 TRINITY_DN2205_c0_g1~~TRINITY_DN2205_c0_g1_i1.p3  ORF type:complete len:112 (-),score=22.68 TRINITY_DN2205_c0_g1_i1:1275-1610(-)